MYNMWSMENRFKFYNHLGFHGQFYTINMGHIELHDSFDSAVKSVSPVLDVPAVLESVMRRNILGNRTIVKNVYKSPWMAKPNPTLTEWDYYDIPKHKRNVYSLKETSDVFLGHLKSEISDYLGESKNIGILLTGGMDSRMVAGVLDLLTKEQKYKDLQITALTWGKEKSRDTVYAKRIAERLGWQWVGLELNSSDLERNIEATAIRGCEFSPIHLHSMLKVRDLKKLDCVLAGSFGDSIGRGEYSGKSVLKLNDIRSKFSNENGFIKQTLINKYMSEVNKDVEEYWKIFPFSYKYEKFERDYQIHYMRRNLNSCLSVINEAIPVYQVFSNPNTFGFIWSLDPTIRNNDIYKNLMKSFDTDLSDIPWARTGLIYDEMDGVPDDLAKKSHSYSDWIKNEVYMQIRALVLSDTIESLNVFNMSAIEKYLNLMKKSYYIPNLAYEERLVWLAALSKAVDYFNIESQVSKSNGSIVDKLNSIRPVGLNIVNSFKKSFRNIK